MATAILLKTKQYPENARVLVTGGAGFLGREVINQLHGRHPNWTIFCLDLYAPNHAQSPLIDQTYEVDIRDRNAVFIALASCKPDLVVHSAALIPSGAARYSTRDSDWQRVKAVNSNGTVNVLEAALAAGCKAFVYTSSIAAVTDDLTRDYYYIDETLPIGRATLHYGRSKALAEAFVLDPAHGAAGLKACVLRPAPIIGPEDTQVISLIHGLIAKGETGFIIGDGNNLSDWLYISNAALAHVLAAENLLSSSTAAGEVFFITNQQPVCFWDLLAAIWAELGHYPRRRTKIPVEMALVWAWLMELWGWISGREVGIGRGSVRDAAAVRYVSCEKAVKMLGYRPLIDGVGLREGVRRSCDGYKKQLAARSMFGGKGSASG
ncbi:hypothetical protein B0A48_05713 [Cryoendolithus antarcticus]|uniref:3-beta hydroxysteroid dehydrogenase/isomerase domain-containing protein n=1 Tax=Cryoendolithus antarcticus TaxID=1507870 RepID=A0A1V8TBQ0_9PEZI|nr:hypothetical protein B0A48_05713 [Cryoendolithus antarcticus]